MPHHLLEGDRSNDSTLLPSGTIKKRHTYESGTPLTQITEGRKKGVSYNGGVGGDVVGQGNYYIRYIRGPSKRNI